MLGRCHSVSMIDSRTPSKRKHRTYGQIDAPRDDHDTKTYAENSICPYKAGHVCKFAGRETSGLAPPPRRHKPRAKEMFRVLSSFFRLK